jgi:hypothetical protein
MNPLTREMYKEITKAKEPIDLEELYKKTNFDKDLIKICIDELIKNKLIEGIKNNNKTYYKLTNSDNEGKLKEVKENLVADTFTAIGEVDELREKIKKMDSNINLIYINIIAIIALFISIFSIITINTNTVAELVKSSGNEIIKSIILINISMVASIGIMLFLINCFIIKPLKKQK